jgi:deoxyribonucleoside regulator
MTTGRRRVAGRMGTDIVVEVAWLYYQDGLNQKEIADRLGLSRATVVNHLQEARAQGLIRITLAAPAFVQHRLAVALCDRFGLQAAYVVPDEGLDVEERFRRVVTGGAMWLPSLLAPGDRLGVAWGRTVHDLAEALEPHRIPDMTVLQLVGSMATPYGFTAETCSTLLAQQLGARCVNLHAPAILSRPRLAAELRDEPIIRAQLEQLLTVNKLLFSTGTALPDSHIVLSGLATRGDLDRNIAKGAAGVICGRFVDAEGRPIPDIMEERMIGIPLRQLLGLEMGILVTPGHDKVEPSIAAIRGGFVSHLVTGASVAEAMLAA